MPHLAVKMLEYICSLYNITRFYDKNNQTLYLSNFMKLQPSLEIPLLANSAHVFNIVMIKQITDSAHFQCWLNIVQLLL